ncbi:MAG: zinc-binding dehydrogenase [Alphaproteobacteria bacterium]|nr:zinc-binding dehydrogenase [Alphaproteobacteria bacterium]
MRAIHIKGHGGLDQVQLVDIPEPVAGPDEAIVEVKACGLNYLDIFVRRGMPGLPVKMPRIPGGDVAGVVKSVGAKVDKGWVGLKVLIDPAVMVGKHLGALGEDTDGGLRERMAIPAVNLIALPGNVTCEQAAALPIGYGTAHRMMVTRGRVAKGELVLILGASGGVGTACVQIAKEIGATVIACASSADKLDRLKKLGADHVVDYTKEDFSAAAWKISAKQGVDVCVNYTGGDTWVPSLRAMRMFGRVLTCGATAGFDPKEDIRYIWRREIDIVGSNGWTRADLTALVDKVSKGTMIPVIDRVLPLAETREAMRALEAREIFGKVLLRP